ncbi:MAG: hypothetical protein VX949_00105 [Planctomycetota bacterium]|nr:hypothetical protein [Planctomycetota bacterium]
MVSRILMLTLLTVSSLIGFTDQAQAGGGKLGKYSVVVYSVDDWQAERDQYKDSDVAKFLQEPSIQKIGERLAAGIGALVAVGLEDDPEAKEKLESFWEHLSSMSDQMTGEFVFGVGYQMDPLMGIPMPDLVMDFHGPAEFGAIHNSFLSMLKELLEEGGQPAPMRTFSIGDIEFTGIEQMPGVGIFVGQFEDHHVIGTNKMSLEQYLAEGGTTVGERFDSTRIFQQAQTHLRRGSSRFYLNLDALWNLIPMADMFAGGGGPPDPGFDGEGFDGEDGDTFADAFKPSKLIDVLGIETISGIAARGYYTEDGIGSDVIMGIEGRKGILGIIPAANSDISIPGFVPEGTASFSLIRLEFSKLFDIIISIASTFDDQDPEEMAAEMEAGLEEIKLQTGIDVMDLVDSIEGSLCTYSPPIDASTPAFNPMAAMMGGSASPPVVICAKLRDRGPWDKLMESLAGPDMMGPAIEEQEFQGRKLWSFDPLGDVPPEFAGQGSSVIPAWTLDGDWLIFSTSVDDVKAALRLLDGEGGEAFGSDKRTAAMMAKIKSSQGWSISMVHMGQYLSQMADIFRPLVGMLPLMIPDIASNEELLFLFDPENIPESALLNKYFGWVASRYSIVEGGIKGYTFQERVTEAMDSDEKKEPAPRGSQL